MNLTSNISEKLDTFFKENDLSSYKVAKITGISEPSIGRYRNGKSKPTSTKLEVLLKTFPDLQNYLTGKQTADLENQPAYKRLQKKENTTTKKKKKCQPMKQM